MSCAFAFFVCQIIVSVTGLVFFDVKPVALLKLVLYFVFARNLIVSTTLLVLMIIANHFWLTVSLALGVAASQLKLTPRQRILMLLGSYATLCLAAPQPGAMDIKDIEETMERVAKVMNVDMNHFFSVFSKSAMPKCMHGARAASLLVACVLVFLRYPSLSATVEEKRAS